MEETAYAQYDTVSPNVPKQVKPPIVIELDTLSDELVGLASTVDSLYVVLNEILGPDYPGPASTPAQDIPEMSNLGNRLNSMRGYLTDSNSRIKSLVRRVEL